MRKVWCEGEAALAAVAEYLRQNDIAVYDWGTVVDPLCYALPIGFSFDESAEKGEVCYDRGAFNKCDAAEISSAGIAYLVDDPVNHPSHYTGGKVECIEAMERVFGKEAVFSFSILNAWKYLWRRKGKGNEKQDVKKALWYFDKAKELLNDSTE